MATEETLPQIANVLEKRKSASSDTSYVAKLYDLGINKILEKVGEEATEVILAAKDCHSAGINRVESEHSAETLKKLEEALLNETADLWFHTLVMLSYLNLRPEEVLAILAKRSGTSGLQEKEARTSEKNET